MTPSVIDPAQVIRWRDGAGEPVAARTIAARTLARGEARLVLRDTAERLHLAHRAADGAVTVIAGPVSIDQAIDSAAAAIAGLDRHAVQGLVNTLALGLIGMAASIAVETTHEA
ncbi:MAG: hypothetical protein HQL40_05960 [Alphaproteobacteria bacterium]|nr:hypothetical protein [Alphaproteobacteria bacterium]